MTYNQSKRLIKKSLFWASIILFMVVQIYPIAWVFLASIKPTVELSSTPFAFPKDPTFANYLKVFSGKRIWQYMLNSIKVTFVSLILIMGLSSTAGFALSKFNFKVNRFLYSFFTFGIMIPVQITLIPLFIFYSRMRILNTSFSLVLPQVGFALPLSIMIFVSFYYFVPNELIEAATIDGCSPFGVFTRIITPMAKNTFITIASMHSIFIWNDFIFANTFISKSDAKTVAIGLKDYVGAYGNVDWGLTFAAISISILPPIILYFSLNKYVTVGITAGSMKG
jgi:raffinose/stachyose/melibiose transport system permease protein